MIRRIPDIFKEKKQTCSFELFAPKTEGGIEKLFETAAALRKMEPDWFSVTYGAAGTTRGPTMGIVDSLQERFQIPAMHHLTCVGQRKAELKAILKKMKAKDICNVLAVRGDPPQGVAHWEPAPDGLVYSYQLVELIRSYGDFFSIGVAGFPEGHPNCPDKETDARYLKTKIDAGAEFVITQLFLDNREYFEYMERIRRIGITVRIIPGILPITDYQALLRFCNTCGVTIPRRVHDTFKPLDGNARATHEAGIQFAVEQCQELLKGGAPGLHFYTLNRAYPTGEILKQIKR